MSMKFLAAAVAASTMLASAPAMASTVMFIPSTDMAGSVFTSNTNDFYAMGRGVVFKATSSFSLTSVALYQSLVGQNVTFSIQKGGALTGDVTGGTMLWSTSQVVTTSGLELIDFLLPTALTLEEGETYFLNFSFAGSSGANFFYNEGSEPSYSVPGFSNVNGTQNGNTANTVIPRIELTGEPGAVVPEPATWALMITGFGAAGAMLRRRRIRVAATA